VEGVILYESNTFYFSIILLWVVYEFFITNAFDAYAMFHSNTIGSLHMNVHGKLWIG